MRKPFSALALALVVVVVVEGCTSDKEAGDADNLDVTTAHYDKAVPKGTGGLEVPKSAVTNWQAFFKAPPTQKERALLEQKLEKWIDTDKPGDLVTKGRAEVALGRHVAAETSFRKALRLKADYVEAQLELAALYLKKKDVTNAFEYLSQVREGIVGSDDVGQSFLFRYRYVLALGYIARGERNKGHKVLSDLIGIEKTFAPAYASLASSYLEIGKESVAEFVVRRGLDRVKDNATLLNLMGVIAQRARKGEEARGWFDKALAVTPGYAPALTNRALLSAQTLEYGAAEEDLLAALQHDPSSVDALVALGIVQRRQGNFTGAKASFGKAVDLDPINAYARFNLGVLLADDLKKPNEALRLFTEVLQTASSTVELKELARNYINDLRHTGVPY